ncbi:hypothetical protein [Streptomyces hainanensis]|uniref:Uncharacterized protein n=1 Tax=Streptomyces hainanensis TaxID=402648 RepID=A0A4R4SH60_9ACTN|nr:hypothetical protein [Streptomyces hainanensis]TDC62016.1 hypothetical protein E1283_34790 [Streptomyces hainanensis]
MLTQIANEDSSRLSLWQRVREFAVPPSMIETATARRRVGDWAGACAAARVDVDLNLRSLARAHGGEVAARLRADLRHLAPDLLRWHLPRIAPDGLLRPGLTIALARYESQAADGRRPLLLVVRTPPAWASAGQRISLALWDGTHAEATARRHPHPHPGRRFRLDLHRHLWDTRRTGELPARSGAEGHDPVDRWAAEARILLAAEGRRAGDAAGAVLVRLAGRRRLLLDLAAGEVRVAAAPRAGRAAGLPVLPDAATWQPPDVALLRAGVIEADRLHPLVAAALAPDHPAPAPAHPPAPAGGPRLVDCRGARHRIAVVDGVLVPLDHDPVELRREELLAALTGTPLPCLRAVDEAHRRPTGLAEVRARLDHGDTAGALAVVEQLLGSDATLRDGELRDELAAAVRRRIDHGMFRAGLAEPGTHRLPPRRDRPGDHRSRPRHTTCR